MKGRTESAGLFNCDALNQEGISDPYGQPLGAYRASVRRILECVDHS